MGGGFGASLSWDTCVWLLRNLDAVAPFFTAASTTVLAVARSDRTRRVGFGLLLVGVGLWGAVALVSEIGGRPVWGMVVSSVYTAGWAAYGMCRR